MQKKNAEELLKKYAEGNCTEEEKTIIENWYPQMPEHDFYPDEQRMSMVKEEIWNALPFNQRYVLGRPSFRNFSIAASLLICLGLFVYYQSSTVLHRTPVSVVHDIAPGSNKATLILANGRKIILDDSTPAALAKASGLSITRTADGKLLYVVRETESAAPDVYNTIITPRGGQYHIQLPDQTRVWLNASSALKFPTAFAAANRKVELVGEAYFEVAKDAARPFSVSTAQQKVEVLGTHFNISSYSDEGLTKTTLLEGSVKVNMNNSQDTRLLKPGQQCLLNGGKLSIAAIDTEEVMAWKNGLFIFNNEELEHIMRKVSRWYNVEIEYENDAVKKEVFGGSVSRFEHVSRVLHMLEITGNVRFKIADRKITVMNK